MRDKSEVATISVFEFFKLFPDESSTMKALEGYIWKDGVSCSHCKSTNIAERKYRKGYRCRCCRKDFTVKTSSFFEKSKVVLRDWLYAVYLLQMSRKGVSSLELSKTLGVTQKTAWFMLHRLREASASNDSVLSDIIEVDETYIGGEEKNKHADK